MSDRVARLSLTCQGWTGWSREQPSPVSAAVAAIRGQSLTLRDFIPGEEEGEKVFGFQIRLMTLLADRAVFEYRHLVIPNPSGTLNLSGPFTGTFLLRPRQQIELATPTMDGGLHLTLELTGIDEQSDA